MPGLSVSVRYGDALASVNKARRFSVQIAYVYTDNTTRRAGKPADLTRPFPDAGAQSRAVAGSGVRLFRAITRTWKECGLLGLDSGGYAGGLGPGGRDVGRLGVSP